MILWTIQPEEIYDEILNTGIYICDIMLSQFSYLTDRYDWLVSEMKKRLGDPQQGVNYPVWAWYKWENERKKPDLHTGDFLGAEKGVYKRR